MISISLSIFTELRHLCADGYWRSLEERSSVRVCLLGFQANTGLVRSHERCSIPPSVLVVKEILTEHRSRYHDPLACSDNQINPIS
jgi:hypothetical protein